MQETRENILDIINSCETVLFSTFSLNSYPETRYMANIFNREREKIFLYIL